MTRAFAGAAALLSCGCGTLAQDLDAGAFPVEVVDGGHDAGFVTAPHLPWPVLTTLGGPTVAHPRLVTIAASNDLDAASYFAFGDGVGTSDWWKAVGAAYDAGSFSGSLHLTGAPITQNMSRADVLAYAQATVDSGVPLDGTNIFFVFLPTGVQYTSGGFCGYHTPYPNLAGSRGDSLATAEHNCVQPVQGESDLSTVIASAAHEIAEATSDPVLSGFQLPPVTMPPPAASVWQFLAPNGVVEDGDLCDGTRWVDPHTGWAYQRVFSNAAAAQGGDPCIPAAGTPYFAAGPSQEWFPATAGAPFDIPVTGWSVSPVPDWNVDAFIMNGSQGFASTASVSFSSSNPKACNRAVLNNGQSGAVHVTVPAGVVSGDYLILSIVSFRQAPACGTIGSPDAYHLQLAGAYVP